jgi:two-component system NarL family sensor kinase
MTDSTADGSDWTGETTLRCTHDLTGRLLSVCGAAAHALGYEVEDLLEINLGELVAPEFHGRFQDYLDAIRRSGHETGLLRLRTRAGAEVVWEFRNTLQRRAGDAIVIGAARDVTDRVRSEQALKASEGRFAVAFDSSPIAMAITTLDEGRYVEVNEAFVRQMGYARDEVCGRTSLELSVWPTRAERDAMIAALLSHKTVRDQNQQFRTKSGSVITTRYSAGLITLDGARCVLAAIADVTAQKQAEDALRESEAKFRMLAETTQAGIFIYREDDRFCYFNPQVAGFLGYSTEELLGMSVGSLVDPDQRDQIRERILARRRGEPVSDRYQFKVRTKSGETRWLDVAAQLIEYQGRPAIMGTGFDITESKRSEQQAKEYTELLQTLIANSPYAILMGGREHRIRYCNSAFQHIFQYTQEETVGRDPDDLVGLPESAEAADISARVLRGEVVHATSVRRRKDGSRVDVEFHAVPLISNDEFVGCFGIYQDITGRIQSEAKLRSLRDRLTRVQDDERAHTARELHDDIGQRLALLAIQLEQLLKEARDIAPSLRAALVSSRRLAEEICADAHRISHRLHPTQVALLGLTTALTRLCEAFTKQTSVEVDFTHDDISELPLEVSTCLYRIAQEAIQNATRHSQSQTIDVTLSADADVVRLCVSDAGCGFDQTSGGYAAGLGLVSMAERAGSVGGQFSVRSAVNAGTRLEVSIPLPRP